MTEGVRDVISRLRITRELSGEEYKLLRKKESELGEELTNDEIIKMFNMRIQPT